MPELVSCVMVTGKDPSRLPLAKAALTGFQEQTWPHKELLIINDSLNRPAPFSLLNSLNKCHSGPHGWCWEDGNVREYMLTNTSLTLGALRSFALTQCEGSVICQLDDDDYSHPDRIEKQMRFLVGDIRCVCLSSQVRVDIRNGRAFIWREPRGIVGTILHRKTDHRYEYREKAEDWHFWNAFPPETRKVMPNDHDPELYIRLYHGNNTWDEKFIMRNHVEPVAGLPTTTRQYVEEVLARHYQHGQLHKKGH